MSSSTPLTITPPSLTMEDLRAYALASGMTLRQLDKLDAEDSLEDFWRLAWPIVEPNHPYVSDWAMGAIAEHLTGVHMGQIRKLLINQPPGTAKSLTVDVMFPAWEWGPRNTPFHRYLCTSYAQPLKVRDNRRCRNVITSQWYQELWGDRFKLVGDQNTKTRFDNDKTGFKIASAMTAVMGERGTRVLIDDPHSREGAESDKEREATLDTFVESLPTRVTDREVDAFIITMQRLHARDVSGHAIWAEMGYVHLCLPMHYDRRHPHIWGGFGHRCYDPDTMDKEDKGIVPRPTCHQFGKGDPRTKDGELLCPERMPKTVVVELMKDLSSRGGSVAVAGQLEQLPTPRGGGKFQAMWWQYLSQAPGLGGLRVVCRWDLADTQDGGDWTVRVKSVFLPKPLEHYVILDVKRWQRSTGGVDAAIMETALQDGDDVEHWFPDDGSGSRKNSIGKIFRELSKASPSRPSVTPRRIGFERETKELELRAAAFAGYLETLNVFLVRGPWNDSFVAEHSEFPRGAHDDMISANAGCYNQFLTVGEPVVPDVRPMMAYGGR